MPVASSAATVQKPGPPPPNKAKPSFLHLHRWQALAAVIVLIGASALGVRWWLGPQVSTESVVRRDFVQTVVASGHVEAPHRLDVGVQITGTLLRIPVIEGQAVKAGDRLVDLEAAELNATGRQAEVAVVQAQAKLRQLEEVQGPVAAQNLRQAQSSLANARAALARSQELVGQGFIGQAALDDARKTTELADAEVQPGKVLMTLSPQGRTQLIVAIDEKNLALLAMGQSALVSADAYPTQRFEATLAYINPGVNATTGAVEVKLDVAAPPAVLKQDMTVSVDIAVARRPQALIVPLSAVHDADAAPWVLRLEGRHAVRRPVQLGLRSGGLAEVIVVNQGGLAEGDAVLVGSAAVKAGARVRATSAAASAASPAPK